MSKCGLCGKELVGKEDMFGSFGLMPPSASLSHTLLDSALQPSVTSSAT